MVWADRQLARFGDFPALVCGERELSSARVHDESCRLAAALVASGLAPGDRVVLWLPASVELVLAFTAVIRAGAAVIVASDASPRGEVETILAHARPTAVVTTKKLLPDRDSWANVVRVILDDEIARLVEGHEPMAEPVPRASHDIAQIVYTSGTTGTPKGVVYEHGVLDARYSPFADRRAKASPARRSLCALPLSAAFGAQYLYLRLLQKMTLVLLPGFDPERVLAAIEKHRIEATWLVPSMCEALLACATAERHDLSSLGSVLVGGSSVSPVLVRRFREKFKVRLTTVYGLTELGPVAQTEPGTSSGSVGRLRDGVRARAVDTAGRELPPGQIGEIEIQAERKAARYWNEGGEGGEGATPRDWFKTGDLGFFDDAGELHLVGRTKELVIQGGINVHPQQIVDAVLGLAGVRDCAVIGVPDPYLGEAVVACVVREDGVELSAEDVVAHCRERVDARRLPTRVHFLATLPRNQLGKVKLAELRDAVAAARREIVETPLVARLRALSGQARLSLLAEEVESRLVKITRSDPKTWQGDRTSTFGTVGLDSLGAVVLANALGDALGRPLSATLTFDHPTIAALCQHLVGELFGRAAPAASTKRAQRSPSARVAIIGIGCRLPAGIDDLATLWRGLLEGLDATKDITRWNMDGVFRPERGVPGKTYTKRASLLEAPDAFDADFFGMTAREATALDPQHRIALEVAWEALEDAGYPPNAVPARSGGVFLGISHSRYRTSDGVGSAPSMAAGRISHLLDLHGPSIALDTACSSSLVAVHYAVRALRSGDCDLAVAGGVNVICSPAAFVGLSQIQALSADGRCKAFSASADGFGRGDGCVIFVLKRLDEALADRDRIVAVIRGSAVNHDGRSASLTAPNGAAQEAVIRSALADADVKPGEVDYFEAHGTGTPLGDPIEARAAVAVFGSRGRSLLVGSAKTNFGHLEAAAGALGLAKAALVVEQGIVPPHLHLSRLNPILEPIADQIAFPREPVSLADAPRIACVTSMGMSGTNAHVILESAPASAAAPASSARLELLCVSARSEEALRALASKYAARLGTDLAPAFADACFTAGTGRAHFSHRLAVVAETPSRAAAELAAFAASGQSGRAGQTPIGKRRPVAFLFTGQGSQYAGMGRALYETEPVFRKAMRRCAEILGTRSSRPLLDVLYGESPGTDGLGIDDTAVTQPALFAVEWSLTELWRSWGIVPDYVMGHSLGELVAACVAGLLDVESALALTASRGALMQAVPTKGAMLTAFASADRTLACLHEEPVDVAAINGPDATVLSGAADAIERAARVLGENGIEVQPLKVSTAFHSRLMDPMLDAFEDTARGLSWRPPGIPIVSTSTGAIESFETMSSARYWRDNVREPVLFAKAMQTLHAKSVETFVEIGPHPVLLGMAVRAHPPSAAMAWLPSLRRDRGAREQMLETLGNLYVRGENPNFASLHDGREPRRVRLPTYAFQRGSYWDAANSRLHAGGGAAMPSGSSRAGTRRAPPAASLRTLLAADSPERRRERLLTYARRLVGEVVGGGEPGIDEDLLGRGLDSLRLMQMLAEVRRTLDIACTPADILARPSVTALATLLMARFEDALPGRDERDPLVVLREGTSPAAPLLCFHPAGGQVSVYLAWSAALGKDQPLFALQSPASSAEEERPSLDAMAEAYASRIQAATPGPYRLAGWSMGGLLAHAAAGVLERRGERVDRVVLIDPPAPESGFAASVTTLVLFGIVYDLNPEPPEPKALLEALRTTSRETDDRELYRVCQARGFLPRSALREEEFTRMAGLYRCHADLVRAHRPGVVGAPLEVFWAESRSTDWSTRTTAEFSEKILGGTHYTVARPPLVAAALEALRGSASRPA